MRKESIFRHHHKKRIDQTLRNGYQLATEQSPKVRDAYHRLINHIRAVSRLMQPSRRASADFGSPRAGLDWALFQFAEYHTRWIRRIEKWTAPKLNDYPQYWSLVHHLFARYPIPPVMAAVWLDLTPPENLPVLDWFWHLAEGYNLRTAPGLPFPLTKKMAHHFAHAPHHLTVAEALRWGQVRGLGGTKHLANAIIQTRLGREFVHEEFWREVIHFLINHPPFDFSVIKDIIEFIHHERFHQEQGVGRDGVVQLLPPAQPRFSVKGRTLGSLLRSVARWRREHNQPRPVRRWPPSGIDGFVLVEGSPEQGNMRRWVIRELLSSLELHREGRRMRNCVAWYVWDCQFTDSSIWSMELETRDGVRPILTIELDRADRTITQALRKCNRNAGAQAREVLSQWAEQENLTINVE